MPHYTIHILASFVLFSVITAFVISKHSNDEAGGLKESPNFSCGENASVSFSCYAKYYREMVASSGIPSAIADLKEREETSAYTKKECHLLMHEIGRAAASGTSSIALVFAKGDPFCATGYYHGAMEGLIQKRGTKELSTEFLNDLCLPFRNTERLGAAHQDCTHGLGHGIMYVNNNELFDALLVCNLLQDTAEQNLCWSGVFMENAITDFRDHTTKYLKPEDPMYPCNIVDEKYQEACYTYQSMYVLRVTGNFPETFAACRKIPEQHRGACFQSIGRDATADQMRENFTHARDNCLLGFDEQEETNCIIGAVRYIIANHNSKKDGEEFCAVLPKNLQPLCLNTAESYARVLSLPQ